MTRRVCTASISFILVSRAECRRRKEQGEFVSRARAVAGSQSQASPHKLPKIASKSPRFTVEQKNNQSLLLATPCVFPMADPNATLSQLSRSDGSATYNCPATGVHIVGSVTGPVELPGRRDAQRPEDATLEVLVKPGTAQSAIGERYAEGILRALLSRVVLGREKGFPRRGVVVTLLILGGSVDSRVGRGESVSSLSCSFHKLIAYV